MIRNVIKLSTKLSNSGSVNLTSLRAMSSTVDQKFQTFSLTSPKPFVVHVEFNRPEKLNAVNRTMWDELGQIFNLLNVDPDCRSIVLSGAGKAYCAGIDIRDLMEFGQEIAQHEDVARKGQVVYQRIKACQNAISSIENCVKPVITAVQSACVGAGLHIASTADIRYCTKDAFFILKEVDLGLAADVGALQRLPKVVGSQSLVRELCFTARKVDGDEALKIGLVNRLFDTKDDLITAAIDLAHEIARKSPVAVQATKRNLVYSLDHTNQEGLDHILQLNTMNLQSEDLINAVMLQATTKGKEQPDFEKL